MSEIQSEIQKVCQSVSFNIGQKHADETCDGAVTILALVFDNCLGGWLDHTLRKYVRSYVISAWEQINNDYVADPKEVAKQALILLEKDFTEQISSARHLLEEE